MYRRTWIPGILVPAFALSGCGFLGMQGDVAAVQNTTQNTAAHAQQNASSERKDPNGAATTDTTKALAKATYSAPFAPKGTVDVAVHSLKRRGKLVDLVFSITPHVPPGVQFDDELSPFDILGDQSFNVTLIDTVNVKRHVVVKDSEGKELKPDDVWTETRIDQPLVLTYTFAAPPENVTTMDVHIANWAPFTDVPVES